MIDLRYILTHTPTGVVDHHKHSHLALSISSLLCYISKTIFAFSFLVPVSRSRRSAWDYKYFGVGKNFLFKVFQFRSSYLKWSLVLEKTKHTASCWPTGLISNRLVKSSVSFIHSLNLLTGLRSSHSDSVNNKKIMVEVQYSSKFMRLTV